MADDQAFLKRLSSRRVVALLCAAQALAFLNPIYAQQLETLPKVGILLPSHTGEKTYLVSFLQGLSELGYIDGKNIIIERRIAIPTPGQLVEFADELVNLNVDVIVTSSTPATKAVKSATSSIPIVVAAAGDLVRSRLVESLARPGGNITGLSMRMPELAGKRLQLLKQIFPQVRRVGFVWNKTSSLNAMTFREGQAAARTMGIEVKSVPIESSSDFDDRFKFLIGEKLDALSAIRDSIILNNRDQIANVAITYRLPAICEGIEFVRAGALASYATNQLDLWKRAAYFVDRILKGTKPADLPVERPLRVEFVLNLKTATKIGVTLPPEVLQQADVVLR